MKPKAPLPKKGAAKTSSKKKTKSSAVAKKPAPALNPKQQRFVDEYLIDVNATQAATRAGYSKKTANEQGARLLAHASVRAAIQAGMDARAKTTGITAKRVLEQLERLVFFDIRTLYNEDGSLKAVHELSDEAATALVSVDTDEIFAGTGKERVAIGWSKKVRVADRVGSIQLAMRHLKMLTDKVAVGGDGDNPNPIPVANTAVQYSALRERMTKYSEAKS